MMDICGLTECEFSIPYAHYHVTNATRGRHGTVVRTTIIVCAYCRHWIKRTVPSCECAASCHAESRAGNDEGYSSVTTQDDGLEPA